MIETLEDWNDRINPDACPRCCEMPGIGAIGVSEQRIAAIVAVNGERDLAGDYFRTVRDDWTGGGFSENTYGTVFFGSAGGVIFPQDFTNTQSPPFTGTRTTTYSVPNDPTTALATGRADVEAAIDWDTMTTTSGSGSFFNVTTTVGEAGLALAHDFRFYRFRFKIPIAHTGTFCRITFDIVEEPEVGDPFFVSEDVVVDWTGPGDQGDENDESWFTAWQYIDPPTDEGRRYIANIRFTIFQSTRYGIKPEIQGVAFTPP